MKPARTFANLSLSSLGPASLFLVCAVFLVTAAGCGFGAGAGSGTPGGQTTLIRIVRPDGSTKEASMKDLDSLGKGRIQVDGNWEEGPTLPEVLRFAKVTDFQHVTIIGSEAPPITLSKEEVTPEIILDFTNHGTVKFASPLVPKSSWVHDITTIKAE